MWRSTALVLVCATGWAAEVQDSAVRYAEIAPLAPRSLLLDITRADERVIAVGDRGHILLSDDNGSTWRQARVPSTALLTGVYFIGQRGWAVGHDEVILKTEDGGENWTRVHYAPENEQPLLDVWFRDENYGLAVGAYGTVLRTTDGGATWARHAFAPRPLNAPPPPVSSAEDDEFGDGGEDLSADRHLNKIARSATGKLYIAAEAGHVFRSDDDGETWITLPSPYEGSFFGVLPLEGEAVLVFGLRGHLFRSDDAGVHWQEIDTGTSAMWNDGVQLGPQTIVIAGLGGAKAISDDGGHTFRLNQVRDRKGIQALVGIGPRTILTVGEGGAAAESL